MKKRICSIFIMLCMMVCSLFAFTGCNLYHQNDKRFSEEVVACVGNEKITRNEVLTWFNYYYYSAYMYSQYTEEEVYELALNNLVKYKIILAEAKANDDIVLSISDQNDIWRQVFEYVDSVVDGYEDEIRKRYGLEVEEEEEKEEEEPVVFKPYERAELNYSITYDQNDTVLKNVYEEPKKEDNYYRYLGFQKYLNELKKSSELYGEKLTAEKAFKKELNNYYTYYEAQKYVQKYNDYCLGDIKVTDEAIVQRYTEIINTQMQDYLAGKSYVSSVTNSSNKDLVLYHAQTGTFSVQQIVLSFSDMTKVKHNNSEAQASEYLFSLDGFVFDAEESTTIEKPYVDAYLKERENYAFNDSDSLDMTYIDPDTGKTTDEYGEEIVRTFDDLKLELEEIKADYLEAYNKVGATAAEKEKAIRDYVQAFYKLKFSYSKDSGVTDLTTVFNKVGYVFPAAKADMTTSWVSEFTNAAYELYDTYKTDGTYDYKIFVSNYGVHIMMFTGTYEAGPIAQSSVESLKATYFTNTTDQTVYDYIYDLLLNEKQNSSQTNSSYYLQAMLGSSISSSLYERVSSVLFNEYTISGKIDIKYETYEELIK